MRGILVAGIIAVALTGCTAPAEADQIRTFAAEAPKATATPEATPTPEPEPIVQPEPEEAAPQTEAQKNGFKDENDWYLRSIKSSWAGPLPSDADLLGVAAYACAEMDAGAARADVTAVQGASEDATNNNRNAVGYAAMALCPEHY